MAIFSFLQLVLSWINWQGHFKSENCLNYLRNVIAVLISSITSALTNFQNLHNFLSKNCKNQFHFWSEFWFWFAVEWLKKWKIEQETEPDVTWLRKRKKTFAKPRRKTQPKEFYFGIMSLQKLYCSDVTKALGSKLRVYVSHELSKHVETISPTFFWRHVLNLFWLVQNGPMNSWLVAS